VSFDQQSAQDAEPTENYPDDLFATLKRVTGRTNGMRPTVGREEGFVYLTRKGWEFFRDDIEKAFRSAVRPRGTWADFEKYVADLFEGIEKGRQKFIKTMQAKLDEMKKARV